MHSGWGGAGEKWWFLVGVCLQVGWSLGYGLVGMMAGVLSVGLLERVRRGYSGVDLVSLTCGQAFVACLLVGQSEDEMRAALANFHADTGFRLFLAATLAVGLAATSAMFYVIVNASALDAAVLGCAEVS